MKRKTIIFDLCHVLFHYDPARPFDLPVTDNTFTPIDHGIALLKKIHAQKDEHDNRRHQLLILSNATEQSFGILQKQFSDVLVLFDGGVISGNVGMMKPDIRIYHHILSEYQLDPKQCIFIDDKEINVHAAQATGMHGIVYSDPKNVEKQLKALEIIV